MLLTSFSNMDSVPISSYSHLLDTISMPESEFGMFLEYEEMRAKHDYLNTFGVDCDEDIARTLAMFGGFTEGLQLFASLDRKSVVSGKSVSVRVDLGGCRINKKKILNIIQQVRSYRNKRRVHANQSR